MKMYLSHHFSVLNHTNIMELVFNVMAKDPCDWQVSWGGFTICLPHLRVEMKLMSNKDKMLFVCGEFQI